MFLSLFQLLHSAVWMITQSLSPLLVPICFGLAWLLVGIVFWSTWAAIRDTIADAKKMHEIPCANCQFFTNTHFLKCPVHPSKALSTDAINCPDYEQTGYKLVE